MGDIAPDDECAGEREAGFDRVLAQLVANGIHRLVEIDVDDLVAELILGFVG